MEKESLKIIGTAHVSEKSVEEVRDSIREEMPDVVAIELDKGRFNKLMQEKNGIKEENNSFSIKKLIEGGNLVLFLISSVLSFVQKRIGEDVGVSPGSEMLIAAETADEIGAKVVLIDRDINITLKRTINSVNFWEKLSLVYDLIKTSITGDDEIEDIESLKEEETLEEVMKYFKEEVPKVYKAMVEERDAYMANQLLMIPDEKVVAVVGAGHKKGMMKYLDHPETLPSIEEITTIKEPRISVGKIIMYSIPILTIFIFIIGIITGANIEIDIANFVLVVGTCSAIGSLLFGSNIRSAIVAFITAPITLLHPLLAVGWFSGLLEARLRHVGSKDLNDFIDILETDDIESFKGLFKRLWKNGLFRVLMVVIGSNIGCTIGGIISIPESIWPVISKVFGMG